MGRKESIIENYVRAQVKAKGGFTRKLTYQGRSGAPDLMCVLPGGKIIFLEVKAPGEKPDPHQLYEIQNLVDMGCRATWVDTKAAVDLVLP